MAMDSHPSSQNAEIPTLTTANAGDSNSTAVNHSISATNGHADTGLEKTIEILNSDAIEIQPSFEEGEGRADDGAGTRSVSSDDGDGPHDVSLSDDRPNVCFSHLLPSPEHWEAQNDFQGAHATEVSPPNFCLLQALVRTYLGRKVHLSSRCAILS